MTAKVGSVVQEVGKCVTHIGPPWKYFHCRQNQEFCYLKKLTKSAPLVATHKLLLQKTAKSKKMCLKPNSPLSITSMRLIFFPAR